MNVDGVGIPIVNPDLDEPLVISVCEYQRCGVFFAVVSDKKTGRSLLPRETNPSRSPFLTTARRLLAAGYPPTRRIEMVHEGNNTTALISTIGEAARLTVKQWPTGRPAFVNYVENDMRRPRRGHLAEPRLGPYLQHKNNASERPATYRARHLGPASPPPPSLKRLRTA